MRRARWRSDFGRLGGILKASALEFVDDDCTYMAAAIAYHALISVFPLLIFLLSLFGLFIQEPALKQNVLDAFIGMVPFSRANENMVVSAIRQVAEKSNQALSIGSLVVMAWTASNMFGAIRRSINVAYDIEVFRPFLRQKLVDFGMILALGIFFLLSIVSTATVESLQHLVGGYSHMSRYWLVERIAGEAGLVWVLAGHLVPFVLSAASFIVAYRVVPAKKFPLRIILPAAFTAAILFETCKAGFVFYIENFARYDLIFGSLAAVAGFMGWVYLSALVLLFGAEIASEYDRMPRPGGQAQATVPEGRIDAIT